MSVPCLVTGFLVLMGVAWMMAVPPGSSFDEPAHYVKAIAVGRGDLYGKAPAAGGGLRELPATNAGSLEQLDRAVSDPAVRWQARSRRRFEVPPTLIDSRFGCTSWMPGAPATCLDGPRAETKSPTTETYVGTYQPYLYVPAGLAIRAADRPATALRLGRAATLAVSLALLTAAVLLLWSPTAGAVSLLGAVVAVTPMVVFASSVLSPSGPEIAAAICFCAALLRLGRADQVPTWAWVALAASGAVLGAARALGPAFVALALVSVGLLAGPRRPAEHSRAATMHAAAAGAMVLVASAAGLIWELTRQPRPEPSGSSVVEALEPSISHLPVVGKQAIGLFGSLDAPMPLVAYVVWSLLVAALIGVALALGNRRDRLSIVALLATGLGVTLVMSVVYREIGALHGRYALPFLVLIPLWCGEVILRNRARASARLLAVVVASTFVAAGAVQFVGWWASARRFAVGDQGGWLFLGDAKWSPPLGWEPWLAFALVASAAYAAAGASTVTARRGDPAAGRHAATAD